MNEKNSEPSPMSEEELRLHFQWKHEEREPAEIEEWDQYCQPERYFQ